MRWCWVNFQCRGVLLLRKIVGQGPTALVVGAGGGCLDIFSLVYHFSFLSPSLWETARYRLKYCLKGPLSPKQPTNQIILQTSPSKHYINSFILTILPALPDAKEEYIQTITDSDQRKLNFCLGVYDAKAHFNIWSFHILEEPFLCDEAHYYAY